MIINPYAFGGGGGGGASSVTWNPADKASAITLSESDKRATVTGISQWNAVRALTSRATGGGGYYFEVEILGDNQEMVGLGNSSASLIGGAYVGFDANGYGFYLNNGQKLNNASSAAYASAASVGDNIGILLKGTSIWTRVNGVWNGDPDAGTGAMFTGLSGSYFPMVSAFTNNVSSIRAVTRVYGLPASTVDWV